MHRVKPTHNLGCHLCWCFHGVCTTGVVVVKVLKFLSQWWLQDKVEEDELEEEDAEDYLLKLGAPLLELYVRPDEDTAAIQAGEGLPTLRSCATWVPPAAKASALDSKDSLNQLSLDAFEEQFKSMDWDMQQALFKQQADSNAAQVSFTSSCLSLSLPYVLWGPPLLRHHNRVIAAGIGLRAFEVVGLALIRVSIF